MQTCSICRTINESSAEHCSHCTHSLAESPRGVWLVVDCAGRREGRYLPAAGLTIGRFGCDWTVPDENVSQRHVRVQRRGASVEIADQGSTNGTYVHAARLDAPMLLAEDTEVMLASTRLFIYIPAGSCGPGFDRARMQIDDHALAWALSTNIEVGQAFAFVGQGFFTSAGGRALMPILGATEPKAQVIPLLGAAAIELPGVQIAPIAVPAFGLRSMTTDKALYRAGHDSVHVLVVEPYAAGLVRKLVLKRMGDEVARHAIRLNPDGVGVLTLPGLDAGSYVLEAGAEDGVENRNTSAAFAVAEYQLAPLVAKLRTHTLDRHSSRLAFVCEVASYGVPVTGAITVAVADAGREIARVTVTARGGHVEGQLPLQGRGPHTLEIALERDAACTASVVLPGTARAEREAVGFSVLGSEITGSLIPGPNTEETRGIFFARGATRNTPIALDSVVSETAELRVNTPVEVLRVLVFDAAFPPFHARARRQHDALHPDEASAYEQGEACFVRREYDAALAHFEQCYEQVERSHPNVAYYIACCHARCDRPEAALAGLRSAIRDGWTDLAHMRTDEDLASLVGNRDFELLGRGPAEYEDRDVAAGSRFSLAFHGPCALLAIGIIAAGKPWEGWAVVVRPPGVKLAIKAPAKMQPSRTLALTMRTEPAVARGSVYVVVRDARLVAKTTPTERLAAAIKQTVDTATQEFAVGWVDNTLGTYMPPPMPPGWSDGYYPPPPPPAAGAYVSAARPRAAPAPAMMAADDAMMRVSARAAPPVPQSPLAGPPAAAPAPSGLPAAPPRAGVAPPRAPQRVSEHGANRAADPAAASRPVIDDAPEVVCAQLLPLSAGSADLMIPLGAKLTQYAVDALLVSGAEWAAASEHVLVDREEFVDLDVPRFVFAGDCARGRVFARSPGATVRVLSAGRALPLVPVDGGESSEVGTLSAGVSEYGFAVVGPGTLTAELVADDGRVIHSVGAEVEGPGKLRHHCKTVRLLEPGQGIDSKAEVDIVALRVLPSLDQPFAILRRETAAYEHLCCEQTAAKILAVCAELAFAREATDRAAARAAIIAGLRRMERMWLPGRGFKMYPHSSDHPDSYWGPLARRHLRYLDLLTDLEGGDLDFREAIAKGRLMVEDTERTAAEPFPPRTVQSAQDAYAVLRFAAGGQQAAQAYALGEGLRLAAQISGAGAVARRAQHAYIGACLLRLGRELATAMALANQVMRDLDARGRLYSTVDSVAAIALMAELTRAGIAAGGGRVVVDGAEMDLDAARKREHIHSVVAADAAVAVQVTRVLEEDWTRFGAAVAMRVALETRGQVVHSCQRGAVIELSVTLDNGYQNGDLLWVCLPDALMRVQDGGQLKMFAVDFAGANTVRIPLVAARPTLDEQGQVRPQSFAVCVRNMFEEERVGSPGLISVTVTDQS